MDTTLSSSTKLNGGTPAAAAGPCPPSTVLLVEDDPLSQRLASMIFTKAGHVAAVADSVAGGWEEVTRNPMVDLVVIDNHLGVESGWRLAAEIRRRPALQDLPIVIYTGSRDREVVMRYGELGVQAFHLKPFKAEILLSELARAHAGGRRDRTWETPASACRRLKIGVEQYWGLVNTGAKVLEESCLIIRRLMLSPGDQRVGMAFRAMNQQLPQIGVNIVTRLSRQAESELERGDYAACAETLGMIDQVAAELRRRAMKGLEMGDALVSDTASEAADAAEPDAGAAVVDAGLPAYARAILARPVGAFVGGGPGGELAKTLTEKPFAGGELSAAARGWARLPGADDWFEMVGWIERADTLTEDAVLGELSRPGMAGFDEVVERVLTRTGALGASRSGRAEWSRVIEKIGLTKTAVLAASGRLCEAKIAGPLPLAPLRRHVVTMVLLGFELGRLLRLTHPHKLSAAALARNAGIWTLAQGAPLWTAFALACGGGAEARRTARRELLGLTPGEAGAKWLAERGADPLHRDAALGRSTYAGSELTCLVVELAEELAHAVASTDAKDLETVEKNLRATSHPLWEALRRQGAQTSADPNELAGLVPPLARSAGWIAGEISRPRASSA